MFLKSMVSTFAAWTVFLTANATPEFRAFSSDSFTAKGMTAKQEPAKDLSLSFDGKLNTFSMFNDLNNAEVSIEFKKPLRIENMALIQVGWHNWAHPSTLEVTVNDNSATLVSLQKLAGIANIGTSGTPQEIPIHANVSKLKIKVTSIFSEGGVRWGSIGNIGIVVPPPDSTLHGTEDRIMRLKSWKLSDIMVSGVSGHNSAPKDLANAFNENKNDNAVFSPLAGSRINVEFKSPREFKLIAFQQGHWGNWTRIRDLEISIDNDSPRLFRFDDTSLPQATPINAKAKKLTFTVKSVYTTKGAMPWGGFSMIGDAEFGPVNFSTAAKPFNMNATELEFEFEVTRPVTVPVTALVTSSRLLYQGPDLVLTPKEKKYRLKLANFKETKPFGLNWKACHINDILMEADRLAPDPGFTLKAVRGVVPLGCPENPWYDLGKFSPPTKMINGHSWTEGMSYSSSGRFGNSTYNGLLDEVVGDLWFHAYTGGALDQLRRQKFDLYIEGFESAQSNVDSAKPWSINGINHVKNEKISNSWTHMKRTMKIGKEGILTYLVSSLVPGFLVDCNKSITVSSRGGGDIPKRSGAPNEDENRFFRDADHSIKTAKIGPTMVITQNRIITGAASVEMDKLSTPWLVAVWGGIKRPTFWGDMAVAVLFTLDHGKVKWDQSGLTLPAGRIGISTSFHGLFENNWNITQIRKQANLLTGMLRNYPTECHEYYRVAGNEVMIYDEFSYEKWGNPKFQAQDYAPLPPIFVWGSLSRNWGSIPVNKDRIIPTPAGPYSWNAGNHVTYSLPDPEIRHAAFPRTAEFDRVADELSNAFMALPDPKPANYHFIGDSWNTAYRALRVGHSILGSSWVNSDARERLHKTLRITIDNAFRDFAWIPRKELFSGRTYLASLWVDSKVTPAMFGDINSGVGASCYGLYMYSKYSGDWEMAKQLWPRVLDTIRFAEVVNDWAIPMTSAREGILFGGIDMDTIGFLGISAAEKLARQVGSPADRDRLAYLRAKIAPSTALRFTFQNYLDTKGEFPRLWVNGFSESGPNLEWATDSNFIGMDHVAMMFCWEGQQPEMYQFLMQLPDSEFMTSFQRELMDKKFSGPDFKGWRKMPFNQTRAASHLTMRAWLPDWKYEALDRDYKVWIEKNKKEKNLTNAGFYGAFFSCHDRVYLVDWEPARLGALRYDRKLRQLTAELSSNKNFVLEGNSPKSVITVEVDGNPLDANKIFYSTGRFQIKMPACRGKTVITFAP